MAESLNSRGLAQDLRQAEETFGKEPPPKKGAKLAKNAKRAMRHLMKKAVQER